MDAPVSNALWAVIVLLWLPEPARPKGGRPCASDRSALTRIILAMRAGLPGKPMPGAGTAVAGRFWGRLDAWHATSVWANLHRVLLEELLDANVLNEPRANARQRQRTSQDRGATTGLSDRPRQAGHQAPPDRERL